MRKENLYLIRLEVVKDFTLRVTKDMFQAAKKIVIKVGSSLLMDANSSALNKKWLQSLSEDINDLIKSGKQVIIVSSGAVALGLERMSVKRDKAKIAQLQAAASVGQIILMGAYVDAFIPSNINVSQVLLTIDDIEDRRRYINSLNTLNYLLEAGVVPIINENDTVGTAELRYGDNDRLAARVAQMISADMLILFSNVTGLYRSSTRGKLDKESIIPIVDQVTPDILSLANTSISAYGSGGMKTKLEAAKIATETGCGMIICDGRVNHPLNVLATTGIGTWFTPATSPAKAKKQWILNSQKIKGSIFIDGGAVEALKKGNSLLPSGIKKIDGIFDKGDTVSIMSLKHDEIARGLCSYAYADLDKIIGKRSNEIIDSIGYAGPDEAVHRDNMALT